MSTEDEVVSHRPAESALAGAILAGVVVVVWLMVGVALISFGPGSAVLAWAVLVVSVIGWIVSSILPLARFGRWVAAGLVVGVAVPVGLAIADSTPPHGDVVAEELVAVASSFADFEVGASTSTAISPWEAPVADLGGEVRATNSGAPVEVAEAALAAQGFDVTVLNEAGDGLTRMDESRGATSDLRAHRDRWHLRASFDGDRVYLRLRWTPLLTTVDPFRGDGSGGGLLGGFGGLAGGLVSHWVAALVALFAVVFTLASAGAALVAAFSATRARRDRTSTADGGVDRDRTVRSVPTP